MAVDVDASADEISEPACDKVRAEAARVDEIDDAPTVNDRHLDGPGTGVRLALIVGLAMVALLVGLVAWLGFRAYESNRAQQQRQLFIQIARQGALNLTNINHTRADADVQRILESSTGTFHDDFQKRSGPFIEIVKQVQSRSEGSIIEAGLETADDDQAQVLVAVNVKTSNAGVVEQEPRAWRMRISVQKIGNGAKVANVEFVP